MESARSTPAKKSFVRRLALVVFLTLLLFIIYLLIQVSFFFLYPYGDPVQDQVVRLVRLEQSEGAVITFRNPWIFFNRPICREWPRSDPDIPWEASGIDSIYRTLISSVPTNSEIKGRVRCSSGYSPVPTGALWIPGDEEIMKAEKVIGECILKAAPAIHSRLKESKRQYLGFLVDKGNTQSRRIYINILNPDYKWWDHEFAHVQDWCPVGVPGKGWPPVSLIVLYDVNNGQCAEVSVGPTYGLVACDIG